MDDPRTLKPKKPRVADKRQARKMKVDTVRAILAEHHARLADDVIDSIVDDPDLRETLSLVTYGHFLLDRMIGKAAGAAALVLWRGFAWTRHGSRRKKFELSAKAILKAESQLCATVLDAARERQI